MQYLLHPNPFFSTNCITLKNHLDKSSITSKIINSTIYNLLIFKEALKKFIQNLMNTTNKNNRKENLIMNMSLKQMDMNIKSKT